jgi:hypothetical protein
VQITTKTELLSSMFHTNHYSPTTHLLLKACHIC